MLMSSVFCAVISLDATSATPEQKIGQIAVELSTAHSAETKLATIRTIVSPAVARAAVQAPYVLQRERTIECYGYLNFENKEAAKARITELGAPFPAYYVADNKLYVKTGKGMRNKSVELGELDLKAADDASWQAPIEEIGSFSRVKRITYTFPLINLTPQGEEMGRGLVIKVVMMDNRNGTQHFPLLEFDGRRIDLVKTNKTDGF